MSSLPISPDQQESEEVEWARLIPGQVPVLRRTEKKRPCSSKPFALRKELESGLSDGTALDYGLDRTGGLLIPRPLQGWTGRRWLRSIAADWALVCLDWLFVGALLVPLRRLFPRETFFAYATGAPLCLLGLAVLHAAFITLVGHTEDLYSTASDFRRGARVLGKCVGLSSVALACGAGLLTARWATAGLCCIAGALHFCSLWMWRRNAVGRGHPGEGQNVRNVLIVGAGGVGQRVATYIEGHPAEGRKVCGFLDDEKSAGSGVIGQITDLARLARTEFVDEVILAAPKNATVARRVLNEAQRLRLDLEIVPELFGCKPVNSDIEAMGGLPAVCVHAEPLPTMHLALKRIADFVGAGAVLILLSPLLAAISILIKFDSSGPVLYCAPRAGRKGRLFRCYKFRTMVNNADELKERLRQNNERAGPFFKLARDPRITRIGAYLRRYSLDELPQLWNVVRGEMSLVGPRPHPVDDVAGYEIEHLARLDMTPGITGLWQVTARRDPSFRRGMELDREYIRTWSLGLDVRILLRTFIAVMQGSGE